MSSRHSKIAVICFLSFLFTLHMALPVYVNSSFLGGVVGERFVGLVYTTASALSIVTFVFIARFLKRFGSRRVTLALAILELVALGTLAFTDGSVFIITAFFGHFVGTALFGFTLDLLLEHYSTDDKTGGIRGLFLVSANIAWVLAPLIAGEILTNGDYWKIYTASVILLIPVFFILAKSFRAFKDPEYRIYPMRKTFRDIRKSPDISGVFSASFLLQFYFSWMVIYTPLYLHSYLNFSWSDIGIMFSVMLIPYVLIEIPLGKLADSRFGEKETLAAGFAILAISTVVISFIRTDSVLIWTAILFVTRIGASMVEVMSETYFFKKVRDGDAHIVSFFRTMRPWAYVAGPLVASFFLALVSFQYLFLLLGTLMFLGVGAGLKIRDTK